MQTGDHKLILRAIGNVVRAGRVSDVARKIGMSRTSLYWREETSPEFTTVLKVLGAVGVELEPIPSEERRSARRRSRKSRTKPPPLSRRMESKGHYR
jgi:probable addiction module antidote protein